jgi:Protein of unknown function (DUF3619)
MNEKQFSIEIRRALDESTERLPYRVTERLARAREAALARVPAAHSVVGFAAPVVNEGARDSTTLSLSGGGSGWWRFAGLVVPAAILIAGLVVFNIWDVTATANELSELDAEVLTDEVPLDTLSDRGFGVFLKNIRQ